MSSPAILAAIASLEAQLSALKAQLSLPSGKTESANGKPLAPTAAPKKAPAPKEEKEKKERKTSEWAVFTARVRALLKEAGYEKKDLSVGCLQFCGDLKKENAEFASWASEDILARRAAWSAPEAKEKPTEAASVISADGDAEAPSEGPAKKKRGPKKYSEMTPEELAAAKAKREAKKEAKSSAPPSEDEAPPSDGEGAASATSSEKKKRGPPKGLKLTEEQKAQRKATREANKAKKEEASAPASPALSASSALPPLPPSPKTTAAPSGFQPVMLGGNRYYINLASGHAYHRNEDGSQGHWAGLFSRTPKPHVDFSVPEPESDFADLDELA